MILDTARRGQAVVADRRAPTLLLAVDTLTAFALHLELGGDWQRFARAPQLAAWLGLTPSLTQSGESSRQGAITKTGSTLARRLLVEAAWHYTRRPGEATNLRARQAGQPDHVLQIASLELPRLGGHLIAGATGGSRKDVRRAQDSPPVPRGVPS